MFNQRIEAMSVISPTETRYVHFEGLGTRYLIDADENGGAFADIEPFLNAAPPDFESLGATMASYGLETDMASMDRLIAEHGLA
jgi:hypothetical protein